MRRPQIRKPLAPAPALCVPIINGKVADLRVQKGYIQRATNLLCMVLDAKRATEPTFWTHAQYLADRILDHTHEIDNVLTGMTYMTGHLHPGCPRAAR